VADHPKHGVQYKRFSFISDRQKGLIEALQEVFPDNHASFCAIHIARNVERAMGKNVSKYVIPLAKTFSPMVSEVLLSKVTAAARHYLEDIPASQWRNTAWLEDPTLPPRYGIRTSNMSESANSMFEKSRDGSWLYSVDTMLSKMMERIASLRVLHKGKTGVVEKVAAMVSNRWVNCAGFKVVELEENGTIFTIVRRRQKASDDDIRYKIDVVNKTCDCGEWQDHGVPCIDAIAYFKLHKHMLLRNMLSEEVDWHYTYEHERCLLKKNIVPVCMERLYHDGSTLPPMASTKRSTGRPKKKRIRKRSRWAHDPEKSNISCSGCHQRGHNVRTCLTRKALAGQGATKNNTQELDLS
jgi:Transposase, Mutator family